MPSSTQRGAQMNVTWMSIVMNVAHLSRGACMVPSRGDPPPLINRYLVMDIQYSPCGYLLPH